MSEKLANPDNWELSYAECRDEHVWTYTGPETQPWKVIEELRRPPENDAWKSLVEYAYAMGGDGARNIESITGHYNTATERATKAEADQQRMDWLEARLSDAAWTNKSWVTFGHRVEMVNAAPGEPWLGNGCTYTTAREAIDAAIAQSGTEPNGLASDTFASGTDWRGNE